MCVISKNYLLYVKRQIHGWREFFSYYSQNDGSREREREGLTNDDDAQTTRHSRKKSPKRGRDVKKTKKRKAPSSPTRQGEKEREGARVQSALKLFFFQRKSQSHIARATCFFLSFLEKNVARALDL